MSGLPTKTERERWERDGFAILLLFHSHLMHRSTDNESTSRRAAMVYHDGEAGTVDRSEEKFGIAPPNIDWMPARRRVTASEGRIQT